MAGKSNQAFHPTSLPGAGEGIGSRRGDWNRCTRIGEDRLFYSGPVFKAEDLDGFVAFINPVINQVVLVNQF